jgi:hypothetical protein
VDRKIIIDGGLITTAKVINQNLLDLLLDLALIEMREHLAGEYVLGQCVKAGIHVRGSACDGMPLGGKANHSNHFNGMMPLRQTLKLVKKKCGEVGAEVLVDAVASDKLRAVDLGLFRQTLCVVSDNRLSING